MQHSQRLDQRLHKLREEVRTMTQEKELTERLWRERLQRCQRQLKAKEEEMSRQSQYFENFKIQLQHKLSLAQDREQSLQNRIYTLEKQLLDMTVSAATGMATIREVRITAGTVKHINEQDRLPSMRGEGEGEEEKKEERRKQWQPDAMEESLKVNEGKSEADADGRGSKDTKQTSNEARLQSFIISLQEDLKVLLEREEDGLTERRKLQEQLQEAQENSHFLGGKVEEMKAEIHQLGLSESSLMEELEELKQENQRLQQLLDAANPASPRSSTKPESTSPGANCSPAVPLKTPLFDTATGQCSSRSFREVPNAEEKQVQNHSFSIPPVDHWGAAEKMQNNTEDRFSTAKSKPQTKHDPVRLFHHFGSKPNTSFQSLSVTTEFLNEVKAGNVEEGPSEESDALRQAFQSLGLGEDLQAQENSVQVLTSSTFDRDDHLLSFPAKDEAVPAQDDLIQALNQENRALAERIQKLLGHIELREEELKKEQMQLKEQISRLEEDSVRMEQENQEQASLISELNKKTEDDLNAIMELQQKLAEIKGESQQQCRAQGQSDHPAGILGSFLQSSQDVDNLAANVIKGDEKAQRTFSQETTSSTTVPSSGCQGNNLVQLTNSIQSLKSEQEELTANISSLREQQREVTLSVQTQTEEKQQLTRTVWALKEQKDCIAQSLSGLKQEKEQLSRSVCGLKDERDKFVRSVIGLKEDKEQLTESLSALQSDKETIIKSLSSGKKERDQVMESLQGLQTEKEDLNQTVLYLKEQRDKLTSSLKCLTEDGDQKLLTLTLKEDHDQLTRSFSILKEEKGKLEHSVSCLKQEEMQIKQIILDLREERHNLQTPHIQTQSEEINKQQQLDSCSAGIIKRTADGIRDHAALGCETSNYRDQFIKKQNDLMKETEALGAELKKLQEEVDKRHEETKTLHSELSQREALQQEAEKKAAQAAEQVMRLTESLDQMEEIRKENQSLTTQVKELQNKLTVLLREKTDALSLKAQREEQINVLTAHLKAKSVALEELNSEYIALKRGRGSRDDLSAALGSLRARYTDIRTKYDALLKRKSQTDLDVAPLKAKLSCLVVKCQERNCLLVEMMKSMQKQDCVDPRLTEQVKYLLSDAALQEYAAAFTPGSYTQTRGCASGFTQEFFSKFQDHNKRLTPDETCPLVSVYGSQQQNEVPPERETHCGEREKPISVFTGDFSEATAGKTLERKSPGPASPAPECTSVQVSPVVQLKERPITDTSQLLTSQPEKLGFQHLSTKQKSPSAPISLDQQSRSRRVSPSGRLSSPEKIINLHEQLQKTLMSSFQAPESRGRAQEPRRTLSLAAQTDLHSHNATKHSLSFSFQHTHHKHTPIVKTQPASCDQSSTLFNAVVSRSANAALGLNTFTNRQLKVDGFKTNSSSSDFPIGTVVSSKDKSSVSSTLNTLNSDVSNSKARPSDTTASSRDSFTFTSCPQSAHSSPGKSRKSPTETAAALEKTARPKPEAPAEVRSVEVIKTVGQSSLLIGWERPPLDELGCSNGTYVYGYRVFVNGDFHKSVMSSACTKCILENVDQGVPVHIGVQTLGSNGLRSNVVQTVYNTSGRAERN